MTSRICSTSWSVSWDTRRSFGIPTFSMISLAFLGPIPWIYWSAMITRLLVGMLTPAMRATALTPVTGRGTCRPMLIGSDQANDNATPSPFPWGRHRSHVSKLDARLINVFNPRSSTSHAPGARGRLMTGDRACPASDPRRSLASARGCLALGGLRFDRFGLLGRLLGRRRRDPAQCPVDCGRHRGDRGHAVDRLQRALPAVIIDERRGLLAIGSDTTLEDLGIVIRTQRLAARLRLRDAAGDALLQDGAVHLEFDHRVERKAFLLEHAVERYGLRDGARETVQDESLSGIGLLDTVGDDRHDHIIGHQLTALHHVLGAQPDRGAGLDRGTQQVAGRKLHDAMFLNETLRLRALPRPRRAEQDQSHGRRTPGLTDAKPRMWSSRSMIAQTTIKSEVPAK